MKVFISADMEGVGGVVDWKQVSDAEAEYERARRWMTAEVNAAIEGALAGGATEIVVNDSHGYMRNILIEELNPAARLVTGAPKPLAMMQGIDPDCRACFFIGYHSAAGTLHSNLDHTYASSIIYEVRVNGTAFGEASLNAALAGTFAVPVVLVTGDSNLAVEVKQNLGEEVTVVAVKEAVTRSAAMCLPLDEVRKLIRCGAEEALEKDIKPFVVHPPVALSVEFVTAGFADVAEILPGSRRVAARRVEYVSDDYVSAFKALDCMTAMAIGYLPPRK